MDATEIDALAKGLVPFVRECIDDVIAKHDPGEAPLPPALAAEVASAMRALQKAPSLTVPQSEPKVAPRIVRIERDDAGNLKPIYDEAP